jgi:hypothetical protein
MAPNLLDLDDVLGRQTFRWYFDWAGISGEEGV